MQKLLNRFPQNMAERKCTRLREKKQDFSGNTDHVILGLGLGCGGVTVMVKWGTAMLQVV